VCEQGGTESGTVVDDSGLVQMLHAITSLTDADFDIASGKAAQNPAHSASVRSHQGPSQETESKENPVKASDRKNPIPPAGFEPATPALGKRCSIP
jgi:hypothetical protein